MKVFDIKDNNIIITPEALTIEVFKKVWNEDKTKDKNKAFDFITFIYHSCDPNSPYADLKLEDKSKRIIEETLNDKKFKITNDVKLACDIYINLNTSPLQRLLLATKKKINDITTFLEKDTEDPDDLKTALDMMSKFSKFINEYQQLEKTVVKEKESAKGRVRGDLQIDSEFNE